MAPTAFAPDLCRFDKSGRFINDADISAFDPTSPSPRLLEATYLRLDGLLLTCRAGKGTAARGGQDGQGAEGRHGEERGRAQRLQEQGHRRGRAGQLSEERAPPRTRIRMPAADFGAAAWIRLPTIVIFVCALYFESIPCDKKRVSRYGTPTTWIRTTPHAPAHFAQELLVAERSHSSRAPPCAWFRRRQTAATMEHDAEAWLCRLWRYLMGQT